MGRKKRFWEIDFLRGTAITLMIFFNYAFTLRYFGIYSLEGGWGFWWLFPRLIAGTFIFLAGISLTLSHSAAKDTGFKKYLLRGLKIFGYGLAITLATRLCLKSGFVVFGILHLIGVSIMLAYPLLRHRDLNLILGALVIAAGCFLSGFAFNLPWLVWLGFVPAGFYTIDYFPLLPWFGVMLIGIAFGNLLYPGGKRGFRVAEAANVPPMMILSLLGRHSLLIYLAHQPALLAVLYTAGLI